MQQLQVDLNNQQNMGQAQQQATIGMQSLQHAMQGGQVSAEWQHGRVQLLPQTIPGSYIPQVYGQHLVMPNNILHPGLGQQQIQLVASNCKFQGGQLGPQMLTTNAQGKQVLSGTAGNFSTYTLPTIPSSQSQTLLFSPVGVISSQQQQQQQNLLPQLAQQQQQQANHQSQQQLANQTGQQQNNSGNSNPATPVKSEQDLQKSLSGQKILQKIGGNSSTPSTPTNNNAQQCVQVPQTMQATQIISPIQQANPQFAPWLSNVTPQLWPPPFVQNGIIFRGTQPDSQNMFIQHNSQGSGQLQGNSTITLPCNMVTQAQQHQQQQQAQVIAVSQASQVTGTQNAHAGQAITLSNTVVAAAATGNKVRIAGAGEIAPKQPGKGPSILPQQSGAMNANRPALSVSTQTAQNQSLLKQSKLRAKPSPVRAINPHVLKPQDVIVSSSPAGLKQQQTQQINTAGLQMPQMHQLVTSMGNK